MVATASTASDCHNGQRLRPDVAGATSPSCVNANIVRCVTSVYTRFAKYTVMRTQETPMLRCSSSDPSRTLRVA
jgi:hypothetical protein